MLITDDYKEQNKQLHAESASYGTSSAKWADEVRQIAAAYGILDTLDYGCGKGLLKQALKWPTLREYDPSVEGKDAIPDPADMCICTDVLEHIEPDCLDSVLDDLQRCTKKVGFFTIATRPAKKTLPDGRNAHLIQQPVAWWLPKLMERFRLKNFVDMGGTFLVVVEK
jgi:hypothetical protein